jgi:hypothetical protein
MNTDSLQGDGLDMSQVEPALRAGVEMFKGGARRRQVGPPENDDSNRSSGTFADEIIETPARSGSF